MSSRTCPLCGVADIPVYRAMCRWCFDKVPWKQRGDFLHAWRRRVMNPVAYTEELIELKHWYIDVSAREPERGRGDDEL